MLDAAGSPNETAWLTISEAAPDWPEAIPWTPELLTALTLTDLHAADDALDADVEVLAGSDLERVLVEAVLDGQCSDAKPSRAGYPQDLLRAFRPANFIKAAVSAAEAVVNPETSVPGSNSRTIPADRLALEALRKRDERFARVFNAMRLSRGQRGTTSQWGNTARELAGIFGRSWLSAEIAIIGAATPNQLTIGGDLTKDSEPFGPDADYGRLLREVRLSRSRTSWWTRQFNAYPDELSRGVWALALVTVAHSEVVRDCLDLLDKISGSIPARRRRALLLSSSRLARANAARKLDPALFEGLTSRTIDTALLLSHHIAAPTHNDPLPFLSQNQLVDMAAQGEVGWPAGSALVGRMLTNPTDSLFHGLRTCLSSAAPTIQRAGVEISLEYAYSILREAADFPLQWVYFAEQLVADSLRDVPLQEFAMTRQWFTEK